MITTQRTIATPQGRVTLRITGVALKLQLIMLPFLNAGALAAFEELQRYDETKNA